MSTSFGDPIAYIRAIHLAATIVATGTVIFELIVAAPAFAVAAGTADPTIARLRHQCSWLIWTSLGVAVISGATWLVLLAAEIYNAPVAEVWRDGGVWAVAGATRFGQVSFIRLAAAALLAAWLPVLRSRTEGRAAKTGAVVLAIAVLIGPAWVGHAGATPGLSGKLPLTADALHLLAAGAWLGGLPPLAMLVAASAREKAPLWSNVTATAVHRFSRLGFISVSALLASGIINSWYEVGSLSNLFATAYGQLVLIKIGLFTAMLTLAAVNRFYLTPRLATAGIARRLQHSSLVEAGLGFAAVVVVGFLGVMAPASHAHHNAAIPEGAAFVHIHSNAGMADVTIMPGRVGSARAIIRLWNDEFEPLTVERLTFTLTPPGGRPITRPAAQAQDGSWQVDVVPLSQAGNWTAAIDAGLDAKRHLLLDAPLVIEAER